jgi:choline dehydrogenase
LARPNLAVETGALGSRIVFEGKRAVGIEYVQDGRTRIARARREVVLAGGVINSPQLLQLSGVGDPEHLRAHGIEVIASLPGVGRNLQDHLDCTIINRSLQPVTLHSQLNPLAMGITGIRYLLNRSGPGTSNGLESGGYVKSRPDLELSDIQLHFVAAVLYDHGRGRSPGHGFTVHACQLRPESRGEIRLRSADPREHPIIEPNYLSSELDRTVMRDSVRISRRVLRQPAMAPYLGSELEPGDARQSDDEIDAWVRANAETIYHPVGTAKMGLPSDPSAVVDDQCRVIGLEGLRVVDASVMPTLVGGNTNAPTIMIAEKISDVMLGRLPLPVADVALIA